MAKYKNPLPKYAKKLKQVAKIKSVASPLNNITLAKMAKEQQKYKTSLFIFLFKFITQSL